ncbi:hypothetical protein L195_g044684, partial [Trifolium pratense]
VHNPPPLQQGPCKRQTPARSHTSGQARSVAPSVGI